MKFNKKLTVILEVFVLIGFLIFWHFYKDLSFGENLDSSLSLENKEPSCRQIKINDQVFRVEVADTLAKKQKGLADRENMPQNYGMIFIFEKKGKYSFWMKGMRFPLDFLWIDGDKIVEITKNVAVDVRPEASVPRDKNFLILRRDSSGSSTYSPRVPADKVIELNAGMTEKTGISLGDKIIDEK